MRRGKPRDRARSERARAAIVRFSRGDDDRSGRAGRAQNADRAVRPVLERSDPDLSGPLPGPGDFVAVPHPYRDVPRQVDGGDPHGRDRRSPSLRDRSGTRAAGSPFEAAAGPARRLPSRCSAADEARTLAANRTRPIWMSAAEKRLPSRTSTRTATIATSSIDHLEAEEIQPSARPRSMSAGAGRHHSQSPTVSLATGSSSETVRTSRNRAWRPSDRKARTPSRSE